jgi:hypothetical protein
MFCRALCINWNAWLIQYNVIMLGDGLSVGLQMNLIICVV